MAHLVTGYAGYAHIKSADDGAFNASFFGDGQFAMEFGNCFAGSIIDNNTVRILDGEGLMYGRHFRIEPNSYEDMTITTGTAGTNRIDLICMTYEKNADDETERCYLQVIKGTETQGTAVAPEYTDGNILEGASFNQMPLYKVTIEGVVLKKVEPMFEILPTYKGLAEYYAGVFERMCDEKVADLPIDALTPADVVDNLESESPDLPLSARMGNELNKNLTASDNLQFRFATDGEGNYGYLKADGSFVPFSSFPKEIFFKGKTATFTAEIGKRYIVSFGGHSRDADLTGTIPTVSGANVDFNSGLQTNEGYKSSSGSQARYYSNLSIIVLTATSTTVSLSASNLTLPCIVVCEL